MKGLYFLGKKLKVTLSHKAALHQLDFIMQSFKKETAARRKAGTDWVGLDLEGGRRWSLSAVLLQPYLLNSKGRPRVTAPYWGLLLPPAA